MAGLTRYRVGEEELTADELVRMGAADADLFYQLFFPKTMRSESAPFHLELDAALEDTQSRLVLAKMFRGSAKTTRLRMYMGRRVAYGMSHTILSIGASEAHATRSVRWLRKQIEANKTYKGVFGLRLLKWQENELEIKSEITGETCFVMGLGITSSGLRGINFDDYRPDLILVDDAITDENAATKEQRDKVIDLLLGAVKGSLAPATEEPNAKMVMCQTPMNVEDAVSLAEKDPQWKVIEAPIWTRETADLPVDQQESAWPTRYPSETVRAEKRAAAAINKLSIWVREHEVRLITPESRAFKPDWLKVIDILPTHTYNVLSIDPLPPPSDREVEKGFPNKDFEAIGVVGRDLNGFYMREYVFNQGHDPSWTIAKTFELALRHNVTQIVIEGVAYQKTLKWILEDAMRRRQIYYSVVAVTDNRKKFHKITQALAGPSSQGRLFCLREHTDLIQQFSDYPQVAHEDILDMFAQGVSRLTNPVAEIGANAYVSMGGQKMKLPRLRGAP